MESMRSLLDPKAVAVVGASQRRGRGTNVIANLRDCGFAGEIFAVNPRYQDVLGYRCFPTVGDLPDAVDCLVVAVAADAACDVLEEAHARGIRAAIVLAAGFGEGGHGEARAARLRSLADKGLRICGPNCFGLVSVKPGLAAYSGPLSRPLRPGPVAIVSQSGGLGANAFAPSWSTASSASAISCPAAISSGPRSRTMSNISSTTPRSRSSRPSSKSSRIRASSCASPAPRAHDASRSSSFTPGARLPAKSWCNRIPARLPAMPNCSPPSCAVAASSRSIATMNSSRRSSCSRSPRATKPSATNSSCSPEAAAEPPSLADALADAGAAARLARIRRPRSASPRRCRKFGSITNPIDGTGAIYDDPALLPKIFDAILADPARPTLAASVAAPARRERDHAAFARTFADAARTSGRTVVAYQYSPLGVRSIPRSSGRCIARRSLCCSAHRTRWVRSRHLPLRREYWTRAATEDASDRAGNGAGPAIGGDPIRWGFLDIREALIASGVPMVETALAHSEDDAVALQRQLGGAVAVKAEAPGLLHKSDLGCVRLGCAGERDVREAYREVAQNARNAGFEAAVLIQPMVKGVAEAYAGIIDDPLFGPAVCFGLGGVFIEIMKDTITEMAPLSHDDALGMIRRIKAAAILEGARGRERADIEALAELLVGLGRFAIANSGRFRALDLIRSSSGSSGAVAVDIAIEPIMAGCPDAVANAAE